MEKLLREYAAINLSINQADNSAEDYLSDATSTSTRNF
jgi:hypothetical protein